MNIYQSQQELLSIFDELEENGGELTEELSERLQISQNEFKDKVKAYVSAIKQLKTDIEAIKVEQKRLKDLSDKKKKAIDSINNVLVHAINTFGDTKPSGVKYINFATGEVSIRHSLKVDVNNDLLDDITTTIESLFRDDKVNRQLDTKDSLNVDEFVNFINTLNPDKDEIISSDVENATISVNCEIPVSDLINGNAYGILKDIVKYTNRYVLKPVENKTELKDKLINNGCCAPHLARLVNNECIQIK